MLSDERLAAMLLLCQRLEHECQALPRKDLPQADRECLDTVGRNITAARKALERCTSARWLHQQQAASL